jgi:hypothetical protein
MTYFLQVDNKNFAANFIDIWEKLDYGRPNFLLSVNRVKKETQ